MVAILDFHNKKIKIAGATKQLIKMIFPLSCIVNQTEQRGFPHVKFHIKSYLTAFPVTEQSS